MNTFSFAHQRLSSQRGAALIIVLFIVALVSIIATEMGTRLQLQSQRLANIKDSNQAYWYALSAEEYAQIALKNILDLDNGVIHLNQPWAEPIVFPLDNGMLEAELSDAQACFNLNAVGNTDNINPNTAASPNSPEAPNTTPSVSATPSATSLTPAQEAFEALVRKVNQNDSYSAEVLRDSLIDFLDSDTRARGLGAEDETYRSLAFPYIAANRTFVDVSELRLVNGVNPDWFADLLQLVCVLPNNATLNININTLTEDDTGLLAALLNITEGEASNLIENRPPNGYDDIQNFFSDPILNATDIDPTRRAWFTISTEYFNLRTQTTYNNAQFRLNSLIQLGETQIRVVQRTFGRQ